jgi:excisionase family DNA binding protein
MNKSQFAATVQLPHLLTVAQVAAVLGMKIPTIRLWIAQRKLPRVSCGRAVRVPASAVNEFIAQNIIPVRAERAQRIAKS